MADPPLQQPQDSPVTQVLHSLGLTREDLSKRADEMRQFLTAQDPRTLPDFSTHSDTGKTKAACSRASSAYPATQTRLSAEPQIKAEPVDDDVPPTLHNFDSMEAVIERKSRQSKKERMARRESRAARERKESVPPSPPPVTHQLNPNMDSFMHSRAHRRVSATEVPLPSRSVTPAEPPAPVAITPSHLKYYRDRNTVTPAKRSHKAKPQQPRDDSPTPQSRRPETSLAALVPLVPKRRSYYRTSPQPSSPRLPIPQPSPGQLIFNIVSSPGPMGPAPKESEYDGLPFKLPPGPYSTNKPDLSYAAIVGRAILSSPNHRLTLQEIYEWITIVFPHFKRGETTWMNSIRHVLSTTACFRKVMRDRSQGRTLWAIWDQDLQCFAGGGFNKVFCAEMMNANKTRPASKKRPASAENDPSSKRTKKPKVTSNGLSLDSYIAPTFAKIHTGPMFPPLPMPHHQPYYEACRPQPRTAAEIVFPPLPPSSVYHRYASVSAASEASSSAAPPTRFTSVISDVPSASPPASVISSFSVSVPELDPSRSSSSPPSEDVLNIDQHQLSLGIFQQHEGTVNPEDLEDWPPAIADSDTGGDCDILDPGIAFFDHHKQSTTSKGKRKEEKAVARNPALLPPMPPSPTPRGRGGRGRKQAANKSAKARAASKISPSRSPSPARRASTPPCTPPRTTMRLSAQRTPISHMGLHMSPSPSLAHYKSHLDPPPIAELSLPGQNATEDASAVDENDPLRTPSRKPARLGEASPTGMGGAMPYTPRRLLDPVTFRTPGSANRMYDPHDPATLLDDELSRLSAARVGNSPSARLCPKGGRLYESPTMQMFSPSRMTRWY